MKAILMNMSLLQRVLFFTFSCVLLFCVLVGSVIWSSQTIEHAFSRDNYARQVVDKANSLKDFVLNDNIFDDDYNVTDWQAAQVKLTNHLDSAPLLTVKQKTLLLSLKTQNKNLKNFFNLINKNKLKSAKSSIKMHLSARLITQLEAMKSDALQLSAIAQNDIYRTIKSAALLIVTVATLSMLTLVIVALSLINILRESLDEVKSAFDNTKSGHFQHIKLSYHTQEFDSIAQAFNEMNDKLSESTVSITEMKQTIKDKTHVLEELSNTDPLTKVANRRALFTRASMEFSRANRESSELTLLLLDCDFFKHVNDEFGHLTGDELLKNICNVCSKEIRDIDFLARYGGEEFIIVLPNCDIAGGVETANRIQSSLAKSPIKVKSEDINVTLSIGICSLKKHHQSLEQLINDVDKAMYLAKENGRNRIEVAESSHLH